MKFNMQNVFVWIASTGYKFRYSDDKERMHNYLRLQIDNSIRLGWPKDQIIPITNFAFEYMGVKANEIEGDICSWSAFANRMVCVNQMIKKGIIRHNFWVHDLDAYQLVPFDFPADCKEVGFVKHSVRRTKPQGASAFYRKSAYNIVNAMSELIVLLKPKKEEIFFPFFFNEKRGKEAAERYIKKFESNKKYASKINEITEKTRQYLGAYEDKFSWLNYEYNLCQQRMFKSKYALANKPVKVVHFKLEHDSTIKCFYQGINDFKVRIVDDELANLFFKYKLLDEQYRIA